MGKVLSGVWKFFKVLLIIIGVITLLIVAGGVYFYNFYTLKDVKVCITNNVNDTRIACSTNGECARLFAGSSEDIISQIDKMPSILRSKI